MTDQPDNQQSHYQPRPVPQVRAISWGDVTSSLRHGWVDFLAAPQYGLFFGAIFAAGGLFILWVLAATDQLWLALPVMIGFPLIGPFIAAGLYEVSRRRQLGQPLSWKAVLVSVFAQRERELGWMAFAVLFLFWVWIYQIRILIALFMGFDTPSTLDGFIAEVLTTQNGLMFICIGTIVGTILALILFTMSVISMPLLLDREFDFVTAIITSFRAVFASPKAMIGWGIVIGALTLLAMLPAFLGLLVVLPVLGHASWHLYQAAVLPETS